MAVWRYVLLFVLDGSDIACILKNDWSYLRLEMTLALAGERLSGVSSTKKQHDVIRVIAITYV